MSAIVDDEGETCGGRAMSLAVRVLVLLGTGACGGSAGDLGIESRPAPTADAGDATDATAPAPLVAPHAIGGTIVGLHGSGLMLMLNGNNEVAIHANGPFSFPMTLAAGAPYQVTVASQPTQPAQVCTVLRGGGIVGPVDVTDVVVACEDGVFPVEVDVTGLVAGTKLVLENDGVDDLTVTMPGKVAFATPLKDGAKYNVTVKVQPDGAQPRVCSVTGGTGTIAAAPAVVAVDCAGWAAHREISVWNELGTTVTSEQVLVVLDRGFSYAKTTPNGADLRFSTSASFSDSLPYFIESWNPGWTSFVWVKVPSVPAGLSTIYMFYDQPRAAPATDFASTFPNVWISPGTGQGGVFTNGRIAVDWFELKAPDSWALQRGTPLTIDAKRVIVAGMLWGTGSGYESALGVPGGNGPGAGTAPSNANGGGGGGAYGGNGGAGANGIDAAVGEGGASYGTADGIDVDMGSSGASVDSFIGGSGGGSITIDGTSVSVTGEIHVDGNPGVQYGHAGGGSGGGLRVTGSRVDCKGALVTANGGNGGVGSSPADNSGGGGGGGRLKFLARSSPVPPSWWTVDGGKGGGYTNGVAAEDGARGTFFASSAYSTQVPVVYTIVGAEQ